MDHSLRIEEITAGFDEAMNRFTSRVAATPAEAAQRTPDRGGWSIAQIAWHVATINQAFAGLIDGTIPRATPAPEGYVEIAWSEIAAKVPQQLDAPERFHPPVHVAQGEALANLEASHKRFTHAVAGLTPERGQWTVPSILGLITVYQVGDWAIAHVIRHNAQAKRALGE